MCHHVCCCPVTAATFTCSNGEIVTEGKLNREAEGKGKSGRKGRKIGQESKEVRRRKGGEARGRKGEEGGRGEGEEGGEREKKGEEGGGTGREG